MATFVGALLETKNRPDFWDLAAVHGIRATKPKGEVPQWVLVVAERVPRDWRQPFVEALSRELGGRAFELVVQTVASAEEVRYYEAGRLARHLSYVGDEGWLVWEGDPTDWEDTLFFGEAALDGGAGASLPDVLDDEISDEEFEQVRRAREAGDLGAVRDLLHLGSGNGVSRLVARFGGEMGSPDGQWRPSTTGRWKLVPVVLMLALLLGALIAGASM